MKTDQFMQTLTGFHVRRHVLLGLLCTSAAVLCSASSLQAAIQWDAQAGTKWWYNQMNWNENSNANATLPGSTGTDTEISAGYGLNAEGVVYDPANDPNFPPDPSVSFVAPFTSTSINQLYITRRTTNTNLLTIKGNLQTNIMQIGRSSGVEGFISHGEIRHLSGTVSLPAAGMELGTIDASGTALNARGLATGTYDYRGGTLNIGGSNGLRLSHGSATLGNANDPNNNPYPAELIPAGTGATGKFIMHNPTTAGFVRSTQVQVASFGGIADTPTPVFTARDPDGITRGVGIFEFHYENGGTRPFQVLGNLSINNGFNPATAGTRSSRLDLKINEPACSGVNCVPADIGLFDIGGIILGTGDLDNDTLTDDDRVFSDKTGTVHYYEGDTVSANYGNIVYNWTISYTGFIDMDINTSVVNDILGAGEGGDIVLMGVSSLIVESADFDESGDVNGLDFLIWQQNAGGPGTFFEGDANGDGQVNSADLTIWNNTYDPGGPLQAVTSVPEPSSALLLSVSLCGMVLRRRK